MSKFRPGASKSFITQSDGPHGAHRLPAFTLDGCVKFKVQRKGTKAREFRLCAVGGAGHGAQLQVMTPGDGSKKLIVGDVNKACRLGWPLIAYEKDYSPEAIASIRELHGGRRRRGFRDATAPAAPAAAPAPAAPAAAKVGSFWPFKKKRRTGDRTVYIVPGRGNVLRGARRRRRRRRR